MIKKITLAILTTIAGFTAWAQSNPTPQSLPYTQNFSTFTGATTTYPAGFQGWTLSGTVGASYPTTAPNGDQSLSGGTNATNSAGVYDMNGKMGVMATGASGAMRSICLALNTTGASNVNLSFDAATQAQTSGGRISEIGLQYRIGTSGAFTNIASSTYSNNASASNLTGNTAVNISNIALTLPAACNNQSIVQLRWVIREISGSGNRPSFSIDNISATAPVSSPTVAITAQDPNGSPVNWALGSTLNQFYWASLTPAGGTATLSSVTANMSGTYLAADIPAGGLKLYYSTDATLVPAGDVTLATQTSGKTGATESITWSSFTQTIATGATGYIYATADIASGASVGSTLAGSFTSNANVVFTPTVNYNVSNTYGATTNKTFAALPTNPATFSVNCASEVKTNIDMSAPVVGNVLVFANTTGSFTDPTGAGSSFTGASANYTLATNYPAVGGRLVYSGSGANFAVSGLTAGQNYSFKAYSYSGSTWSSGTAVINGSSTTQPVSATVVSPSSGQLQLSWTNPGSTSCYNNVIVIARKGLAVESAVSKASFDGLVSDADFTGANTVWTSNSNTNDVYDLTSTLIGTDNTNFLVYKGTGTSVTLTGLTNGTPYYFRIFTVDGSGSAARWSANTDANGTPDLPAYYWNGGSIAALPANGGTGTWGTANAWRQPGASGLQATWADNNAAVFAGAAGLVSLDATRTATSYLFNTSSYTVQTTSGTGLGMIGPVTLANNNELVLAPNPGSTASGAIGISSVNGTGTAALKIYGNQSSANSARISISVAGSTVNVPTTIVTSTGSGVAGYVSTVTGAAVNGNITNNSALTTMIGATSGFDIAVNGVISGTSGLQFSAGPSGGAGIVYLNAANTYSGETRFNSALSGTILMGAHNVIPSGSNVIMAYSSGNGGILDLNGFNQSIGNLSSNVVNTSVIKNNSTSSNSTLTINQTTAQTFGLAIKDGASKNIAIVKNGPAALTLTSNGNSFSGGLTINNGEIRFNPASSTLNLPSCPIALNGGVLGTSGISASSVLNLSTLDVANNSTITLDASATHTINFAASSGVSWAAGKTLVITGWQGVYSSSTGSSGTAGKLFVGTGASDLTAGQLAQIKFFDGTTNYDATLLATGELVPYVSTVTTQLRTTYCGYTAYSFGEFIGADSVLTATQYRFQLVNAATSFNQVFTNASGYPYLTLYTIPGISYNTTYTVTVAWSTDGVTWSPYGSPCTITSPAAETTQLSAGYCGFTATSYSQIIFADNVSGATQYEYKLENAAASYSQSFVKTNSNFNLTQFTGLVGGTTYSVSVRVFIFGAWDIYGPVCNVTTPITISTTSLQPSSCGITVASYPQILFAEAVTGATQYEYKLKNTALGYNQTFVKTNNNFNLAQFTGLTNGATYSVSVRVYVNNTWGNFGPACSVTAPLTIPTTSLQPSSCGITAATYPQIIFAEAITGATQYEYKLTNAALSYTQTFVKTNNNFNLAQFTGLTNGTTYSVSARVYVNNTWGNFGPVCNVTTPSGIATTSLQPSSCGITAATYPQIIFAEAVTGATQYEYKLENAGLGYSQTFVKSNNNFNLTQFTGLTNATTYSVSVRVYMNSTWGSFGNVCTVTTPATSPTTSLQPTSCGITAATYPQILFAVAVTGATQYEYKLENVGLGYSQSFAKTNNNFNLGQFTGLANSTPYSVQVRVYFNGAWGAYGPACTVTTPASAIVLSQNANTLASRVATAKLNGLEETAFDAMAYPNPFNEQFSINLLSYKVNESVSIRVYDATGKLLEQHAVMPTAVSELNIGADYTNGLYNIVITQGDKTKSIKVIRQ